MTAVVEFDHAAAERRAERIRLRLDSIADNYGAVMPMIREAIEKRAAAVIYAAMFRREHAKTDSNPQGKRTA